MSLSTPYSQFLRLGSLKEVVHEFELVEINMSDKKLLSMSIIVALA